MALAGGLTLGLLSATLGLSTFLRFNVGVMEFLAPGAIGFAIGMSRITFKYSLVVGLGAVVIGTASYLCVFSIIPFPEMFFQRTLYPLDPGKDFILHFLVSSLALLFSVVLGAFVSEE